ncbi:MAG: S4 domain-containing protein [Promethearchaeota archaeon]
MSRLDEWLVKNQVFPSKSRANRFVREVGVLINGQLVKKPSYSIKSKDNVHIDEPAIYKYRKPIGYQKLEFFAFHPNFPPFSQSDRCLDIGASFGGYSLYLLEQNVASVHAIEISPECESALKEIQKKWTNFSYRITNFFILSQNDFEKTFNVITADLTLDPRFLIKKLEIFAQLLEPNKVPARLLMTVKTGKIKNPAVILSEFEQELSKFFLNASYTWLDSFPDKQEQILLMIWE